MSIFRVITQFAGAQGSPWMNVLHFDGTSPLTPANAAAAAATFWGAVDAFLDSSVIWTQEPTVVELDEATGVAEAFHTVTAGTGTGAVSDISLPFASQGLIRLFTGSVVNGHQVRGRIFVPGITRNNLAEGILNSTAIAGFNVAAGNLIGEILGQLVIWARPVSEEDATEHSPPRAGSMHQVTSASTSQQFAVMRSRRD